MTMPHIFVPDNPKHIRKALGQKAAYLWAKGHGLHYTAQHTSEDVRVHIYVDVKKRTVWVGVNAYGFRPEYPTKRDADFTKMKVPYIITPG